LSSDKSSEDKFDSESKRLAEIEKPTTSVTNSTTITGQAKEALLNKQLHDSVQGLINLSKKESSDSVRPPVHVGPPKSGNLMNTAGAD